jgi:hypothetical protein
MPQAAVDQPAVDEGNPFDVEPLPEPLERSLNRMLGEGYRMYDPQGYEIDYFDEGHDEGYDD